MGQQITDYKNDTTNSKCIGGHVETRGVVNSTNRVLHVFCKEDIDGREDETDVFETMYNALVKANSLKCKSISFPPLATKMPLSQCANIMLQTIAL